MILVTLFELFFAAIGLAAALGIVWVMLSLACGLIAQLMEDDNG